MMQGRNMSKMFDLSGKKALITGSTQGIGLALAGCLAEYGARVFVHGSRSMELCRRAAEGVPGAVAVSADLSDTDAAQKLYAMTGDVDILILNASVQYRKAWEEITEEEFDKQIAVNLKSSLKLIQKYEPYMAQKGEGRIITVGSIQEYKPHPHMAVYAASKAAQTNMVHNLALQLAPKGITVNNIVPGVIETPRNNKALSDENYYKQVLKGIPAEYVGLPEDMCGAALLLCSEAGRYITGTDIVVDGGMRL